MHTPSNLLRLPRPHRAALPTLTVVTTSHPKPEPEWLSEYRATAAAAAGEGGAATSLVRKAARATITEDCPQCKHPTLEFYTMQLRSADEGQTVFYECPKCTHTFSVNT